MSGLWRNNKDTPEGKYPIVLRRDGSVIDTPYFVLLERDPAFIDAMTAYADYHERLGSDESFVSDIRAWVNHVKANKPSPGDPDAPRHRKDDPHTIAWARSLKTKSA